MIEIAASLVLLIGGAFCLIAALGVVRMPDVFMRMHASTKAGTLGVGLIGFATALLVSQTGFVLKAVVIVAFIIITAPIGSHLLGRERLSCRHQGVPSHHRRRRSRRFRDPD